MEYTFSKTYTIDIPEGWQLEEEGNLLSVFALDVVGVLQISSYSISENISLNLEDELLEYVSERSKVGPENLIKHLQIINSSMLIEMVHDDTFWRYQMIFSRQIFLLVTYNCKPDEVSREKEIINKIIKSIVIC